jgi:hypothetical protein
LAPKSYFEPLIAEELIMTPHQHAAGRSVKAYFCSQATLRVLLVAAFVVGPFGSASAGPVDCEALKDSPVPFEFTNRMAASYVLSDGKEETRPPSDYTTRVIREPDGHITTYLLDDDGKSVAIVTDKHYWRTLKTSDGDDVLSEYIHEIPLAHDPVAAKENFTEAYTRITADNAPRRQRVEAVFVEEGSVTLGDCRFKTHRYRSTLFNEPFEDNKPTTVATIDYAPELMIQVRSESQSQSPSSQWAVSSHVVAISTDLGPLADTPNDRAQQ